MHRYSVSKIKSPGLLSKRIRLTIAFIAFAFGVFFTFKYGIREGWMLFAAFIILMAGHFRYGTIWAASKALYSGEIDKAENLLAEIKRPEWLAKSRKAYYYFNLGLIDLHRKNLSEGEQHLNKALEIGLRYPNDKALAYLNLAHIAYMRKDFNTCSINLKLLKAQNAGDLNIKKRMEDLEKALAQAN